MFSFTNIRVVEEDALEYYKGVRLRAPLLAAKSALWSEGIPLISILVIGHGRIKKIKKDQQQWFVCGECSNSGKKCSGAMTVLYASAMLAVYGCLCWGDVISR